MSNTAHPEDAPEGLYGPDGRPRFFADVAMDRFVPVILNLVSELWLQTEMLQNLSDLLADKGIASREDLQSLATAKAADPAREAALAEFIHRTLGPLRESAQE